MTASLTSMDLDPDLSPLQHRLIQALYELDHYTLTDDEKHLLIVTLEALANGESAPDGIVAGFKEEIVEVQSRRAQPHL